MTSSPVASAHPTTVLVNGRFAPAGAVGRCVERLLATVPPETTVVVFTPRSARLAPAIARRVRSARGGLGDYLARVAHEVAQDRAVIVLPATSTPVDPAWFEAAHARMVERPESIGVHGVDGSQLFAFPPGVVDVDGPQTPWSPLPGLDVWRSLAGGARAGRHRSLSAVLIVKDEQDVLESCLRAVAPFVDQVVVYDTGSTDRTLEIARKMADTVVEGHWDDDFGAARNRALSHATGDWVLSIDADEIAEGDPGALRRVIDASRADAAIVSIVSTDHGHGRSGETTRATRLFQRAGALWKGTLHEQVTFVTGGRTPIVTTDELPLLLVHSGYSIATMAEKDKRARNVGISRAAFESADPGTIERADAAAHYGRSLAGAGDPEAALPVLNTLLEQPASPGNCVQAGRIAVPELLRRGQWELLEQWLDLAERNGEATGQLTTWRAGALVGHDRLDEAATLLDDLLAGNGGSTDVWGHRFDVDGATTLRAELDLLQGSPELAAARMREVLRRSPETVNLQVLVNALGGIGLSMRDLIDEAPEAFLERALRDMVLLAPHTSLHWFSAHSAAFPQDYRPVVAGCTVAARTGWTDALEWSARAREVGLTGVCPLRDLAEDVRHHGVERALAWALLFHGFGADDAASRFAALVEDLRPVDRNAALALVREVVPDIDPQIFPASGAPQIRRRTAIV